MSTASPAASPTQCISVLCVHGGIKLLVHGRANVTAECRTCFPFTCSLLRKKTEMGFVFSKREVDFDSERVSLKGRQEGIGDLCKLQRPDYEGPWSES
jgi:hypothetical protein